MWHTQSNTRDCQREARTQACNLEGRVQIGRGCESLCVVLSPGSTAQCRRTPVHTHLRKVRKGQADGVIGWARGGAHEASCGALRRATAVLRGERQLMVGGRNAVHCTVQRGHAGWPRGSMQPTRRNMSRAYRAAVVAGMAHRHEQAGCWANLLACATQHSARCGVQLGAQRGVGGGGEPGTRGAGRAVDAVCAAAHRWWPVRGGVGLASGGSAPESDGWRECRGVGFVGSSPAFTFTETPRLPRGWLRSAPLPDDRLRFPVRALGADCGIATALRTHCRYCSFCAGARHTGAPEANFATAGEAPQPTPCCVAHHSSCHPQHADGAMVCAAFLCARRHQH